MSRKPIHAGRIERWLSPEIVAQLQTCMRGWYGRPIRLLDVPGSVWVTADGDFIGQFSRGSFMSAIDTFDAWFRRVGVVEHGMVGVGFTSVANAVARASQGYGQIKPWAKSMAGGSAARSISLFRLGTIPAAGAASSAAPGGRALADLGISFSATPDGGLLRLVGADAACSLSNQSLLFYDRLFDVVKTMNSTATEAVTGVPTRYQSASNASEEWAGDNFLFVEVWDTGLAAGAHNWTVCTYTNEAGVTGQTLPSLAGTSAAAADTYAQGVQQWFAPLAAGDLGIKALEQMQCDAAIATGTVNFVIGHPLGFLAFPVVASLLPQDWLVSRDQGPLIVSGCSGAFICPILNSGTANELKGRIYATGAPP